MTVVLLAALALAVLTLGTVSINRRQAVALRSDSPQGCTCGLDRAYEVEKPII